MSDVLDHGVVGDLSGIEVAAKEPKRGHPARLDGFELTVADVAAHRFANVERGQARKSQAFRCSAGVHSWL